MSDLQWWEIPFIAGGMAIGTWLGNITFIWIRRKIGWFGESHTGKHKRTNT